MVPWDPNPVSYQAAAGHRYIGALTQHGFRDDQRQLSRRGKGRRELRREYDLHILCVEGLVATSVHDKLPLVLVSGRFGVAGLALGFARPFAHALPFPWSRHVLLFVILSVLQVIGSSPVRRWVRGNLLSRHCQRRQKG